MKILIDTNVILDVLLKREPFYKVAIEVLQLAKMNTVQEMNGIITRNPNDYKKFEIPVWLPEQALEAIQTD